MPHYGCANFLQMALGEKYIKSVIFATFFPGVKILELDPVRNTLSLLAHLDMTCQIWHESDMSVSRSRDQCFSIVH